MQQIPILSRRRARGFTLIELLVVIAIIAIQIALSLAAVQQARAKPLDVPSVTQGSSMPEQE